MTAEIDKLAAGLCDLYNDMLVARIFQGAGVVFDSFADLTPTYQRYFREAARSCIASKAEPREYVMAQFAAFERYGRFAKAKRQMLPQPNQLFGLGAMARYAEWSAAQEKSRRRRPEAHAAQLKQHFREQRKLDGLCRHRRLPESEVLAESPGEFTPDFLRHKNVWHFVKELYRRQSAA